MYDGVVYDGVVYDGVVYEGSHVNACKSCERSTHQGMSTLDGIPALDYFTSSSKFSLVAGISLVYRQTIAAREHYTSSLRPHTLVT